jgi:hypothetical protein
MRQWTTRGEGQGGRAGPMGRGAAKDGREAWAEGPGRRASSCGGLTATPTREDWWSGPCCRGEPAGLAGHESEAGDASGGRYSRRRVYGFGPQNPGRSSRGGLGGLATVRGGILRLASRRS